MRTKLKALIPLFGVVGFISYHAGEDAKAKRLEYPEARTENINETFAGQNLPDPYRWLEAYQAEEVQNWAREVDALTEDFLKGPLYDETLKRLKELSGFNLAFAAVGRGDNLFFLKRPDDGSQNALFIKNEREQELIGSEDILDPEVSNPVIGTTNLFSSLWPDLQGNFIAFGYGDGSSNWLRIKILDGRTGKLLTETIKGIRSGLSSLTWNPDGSGFYYNKFRPSTTEEDVGARPIPAGIFFHRLGRPQEEDILVFSQEGNTSEISFPAISEDGKYLLISKRSSKTFHDTYEIYFLKEKENTPLTLFSGKEARFNYLGNRGSRFFFQTDHNAPKGKIVSVDISGNLTPEDLIPESDQAMLANSTAGGDVYGFIGNHFILGYLSDGVPDLKVFDEKGNFKYQIEIPVGANIWGGVSGLAQGKTATFSILGLLDPRTVYTLDVESGKVTKKLSVPLPVKAGEIEVKQVFYESKDGTRVPMFVVHKKGLKLNGTNPAFMYGYGFHSWVSFVWYQPHILHFIELGGVYAIPGLRGGGEYGEDWHRAGIKLNRQNAVDDFVWAGRWLIEKGYTSRGKLVANGGSASGPLAGTISVRYPDVFAGSIVDIPYTDLVRAYHYGSGIFLIAEYGSPDNPKEAEMLVEQSPYYQALEENCFIPTLVMVGEKDQTATPFHGYKFVAALQNNQTCENPILMKLMKNTGHNFGPDPDLIAENRTIQILFLRKILGF